MADRTQAQRLYHWCKAITIYPSQRVPSLPKLGGVGTTSVHSALHFLNLSPIPVLGPIERQ